MHLRRSGLVAVLALVLAASSRAGVLAPAGLAGLVSGEGDVSPFGAGDLGGVFVTGWQEIYDASLFGGKPITIAGLRFFRTQFVDPSYDRVNSSVYTCMLITTTLGIDQLSPDSLPDNAVAGTVKSATLFSREIGGTVGSSLTVAADPSSSYEYDPSQGNLLVYITKTGNPDGPSLFLDFAQDDSIGISSGVEFSRTEDPADPGADLFASVTVHRGLVTEFLTPAELATPEPGTLLSLAIGLLVLGYRGVSRSYPRG